MMIKMITVIIMIKTYFIIVIILMFLMIIMILLNMIVIMTISISIIFFIVMMILLFCFFSNYFYFTFLHLAPYIYVLYRYDYYFIRSQSEEVRDTKSGSPLSSLPYLRPLSMAFQSYFILFPLIFNLIRCFQWPFVSARLVASGTNLQVILTSQEALVIIVGKLNVWPKILENLFSYSSCSTPHPRQSVSRSVVVWTSVTCVLVATIILLSFPNSA